jgi:hypothetical protein
MRELLEEAREILGDCYYDGKEPLSDGTRAMVAKVIKRIDAALAAPEPDAKWESIISKIRATDSRGEYRLDYWSVQKLIEEFAEQHAEAASLIESYGRRVPSALFDEIIQIQPLSYAKLGRAFVKHGVQVEDAK